MDTQIVMVPAPIFRVDEARLNITWGGQNGDLDAPVRYDATDAEIKAWATEAIRGGTPGITAAPNVNLNDFVVERFAATADVPYNRIVVRPKTPFGA